MLYTGKWQLVSCYDFFPPSGPQNEIFVPTLGNPLLEPEFESIRREFVDKDQIHELGENRLSHRNIRQKDGKIYCYKAKCGGWIPELRNHGQGSGERRAQVRNKIKRLVKLGFTTPHSVTFRKGDKRFVLEYLGTMAPEPFLPLLIPDTHLFLFCIFMKKILELIPMIINLKAG